MLEAYCSDISTALESLEHPWQQTLSVLTRQRLLENPHGDLPRWKAALALLPDSEAEVLLDQAKVAVGTHSQLSHADHEPLLRGLRELMPWRKGPFSFFGTDIDTEWRSDWKWQRIRPNISALEDRRILDVGCGSGYHCWRMAAEHPAFVLGIDPGILYLMQFLAVRRYLPKNTVWQAPVRLEQLPADCKWFDSVFSMGVLYHQRSPLDHLLLLASCLRPGGELILETLVIEGDDQQVLVPKDRYAQMRNVYFLPSISLLERWLSRCGYTDIHCVDVNQTSTEEQKATQWMQFQSLSDFLHPEDQSRTIEGYPAPKRATLVARLP